MNDHTETVQDGQTASRDQSESGLLALNLSDGIRVDAVAATRIPGMITDETTSVYALVARGLKAGADEPAQALLLLRVRDMAKIIAALGHATSKSDVTVLAVEIGIATERLRHQTDMETSGALVDKSVISKLVAAAGKDGLLDPGEVADLLAGRVPSQPDGDAS